MKLKSCPGLCKIRGLCDLAKLQTLMITDCEEEEIPGIETLIYLKVLKVNGCIKSKCVLELAQLTKLRILEVNDCSHLEELPGVEHLSSLEKLDVSGCPKLQCGVWE